MVKIIAADGIISDSYIGLGEWGIFFIVALALYFICMKFKEEEYGKLCLCAAVWCPLIGINDGRPGVQIFLAILALYFSKDAIKDYLKSVRGKPGEE